MQRRSGEVLEDIWSNLGRVNQGGVEIENPLGRVIAPGASWKAYHLTAAPSGWVCSVAAAGGEEGPQGFVIRPMSGEPPVNGLSTRVDCQHQWCSVL